MWSLKHFIVVPSVAFLLAPVAALPAQRISPHPSPRSSFIARRRAPQKLFLENYPTPPPTLKPLYKEFEKDKDGKLPEHPSPISDPATKVISPANLLSQQDDIFMKYIPDQKVVLCGCGKCGSTSMLEYTYDQLFQSTWVDTWKGHGPPYVQDVLSDRWRIEDKQVFRMIEDKKIQDEIMNKSFSFALIRDPKERLVSAWKSKLACEDWYGVDQYDRSHYDGFWHQYRGFVSQVQRLRGQDENITCMTLEMFAEALLDIKKLGRSAYLDRHFLAQDLGCFYRFPPERWSKVTTIKAPDAFVELASHLGSKNSSVYSMHSSPSRVMITPRAMQLLDEATADEYRMLGPYLTEESPVKSNTWSLLREPAYGLPKSNS